MNGSGKFHERERRDWAIILIILLFGFLCVIVAGEQAIRFPPRWKLDSNMSSNLDPDGIFLTNRPANYFQPLDPSILTQPTWVNVFLTPGIAFEPRTSVPASVTSVPTNTPPSISRTPTVTQPSLTPTLPILPPPTSTPRPPVTSIPPTPSITNTPPAIPVDLSVTKTDGSTTYTAGAAVTYTVVVTNNGPNNVTGATISDPIPAQVTSWGWCVAPCTPVANTNTDLSDTINLASGASITYTVLANTNPGATATDNLVNTASVSVPAGYTDTVPGNNSATDTDTPTFSADLSITKTDNSTDYVPNAAKTYVIQVINYGPSDVTGATVTDATLTPGNNGNLASDATWTCSGTGGGTCTASGTGNISDSVNLPSGATVTYVVDITVVASPSGDLVNTAAVAEPLSIADPVPGNNSATDSDVLIVEDTLPPNMGAKDNVTYILTAGSTLTLSVNLTANGDPGPDLVYYEYSIIPTFDGIWLDWVVIEISDGSNWYTVFNWGDNISDTNTNVAHNLLINSPPSSPEEIDERPIATSDLYNGTGVTIDIDSIVPPGTYTYIRFYAPPDGNDNQAEIDAIEILP